MRVHAFTCGFLTGDVSGLIAGGEGRIRFPVPAFLIEHPKGRVVFDAGMHPAAGTDPTDRLGLLSHFFDVEMSADDHIGAKLAGVGVDPDRIDQLILSHLHFDHSGGSALLPNARLVVQRREWEAGADSDLAARCSFLTRDYQLGHPLNLVDGEHDVFGDGRVVCLPTHGHTPGHQSLRLRLDNGREVVLCADACYLRRNLEEMILPSMVHDPDGMKRSLQRLAQLRDGGATLVYGHDPDEWDSVPALLGS